MIRVAQRDRTSLAGLKTSGTAAFICRMPVPAQTLDGKLTRDRDLRRPHPAGRRTRGAGRTPGLAPSWSATIRARTLTSAATLRLRQGRHHPPIRRDLPADAGTAQR